MTRQEFELYKWGKGTKITFPNHLPRIMQRKETVLGVDFETYRVQIKTFITRRPIWVFCGDIDILK
ncbi:MAG: hypothetical protein OSJ31_05410 [Alistipes sp.]|nr:hypothetical protein [Alistipes sp.]